MKFYAVKADHPVLRRVDLVVEEFDIERFTNELNNLHYDNISVTECSTREEAVKILATVPSSRQVKKTLLGKILSEALVAFKTFFEPLTFKRK